MINKIRNELNINKLKRLKVKVNNARNKPEFFEGNISEIYERIFIIRCDNNIRKSFSYSDVLIGNIEIEYI